MQTGSSVDRKLSRRSTEQRQLIRDILQHADGHLHAEEIYRRACLKSPGLSLSTVYRNLQLFKELGLVEEHQFGSRRCYETAPQAKHHHLVCLGCGQVFEFRCSSTERLKDEINRREGFRVTEAEVRLGGYCPECQQRVYGGMTKTEQYLAERR